MEKNINLLLLRYPALTSCADYILEAYEIIKIAYSSNHKLLVAGNGGSAADAEHIAGELMKRFRRPRPISSALAEKLIAIDSIRGSQLAKNLR